MYKEAYKAGKDAVMDFIKKNPYPTDKKFHAFAESKGKNEHKMEQSAYGLLSDFAAKGMYNEKGKPKVNAKELAMGVKVEMEHTSNPMLADRIAKDHLAEIPDYYTRLKKMEADAGIKD